MLQCWQRTGHLPSFFVPTPGDLTTQESPPPGICHPREKKMLMPGRGLGAGRIDWWETRTTSERDFHERVNQIQIFWRENMRAVIFANIMNSFHGPIRIFVRSDLSMTLSIFLKVFRGSWVVEENESWGISIFNKMAAARWQWGVFQGQRFEF